MIRHDIICATCELIIRDIQISSDSIGEGGKIRKQCPDCKNKTFHTYWGSGEAPSVTMATSSRTEAFERSKTLGEFWDRTNVDFTSKEYSNASKRRVGKIRDKAKEKNND